MQELELIKGVDIYLLDQLVKKNIHINQRFAAEFLSGFEMCFLLLIS